MANQGTKELKTAALVERVAAALPTTSGGTNKYEEAREALLELASRVFFASGVKRASEGGPQNPQGAQPPALACSKKVLLDRICKGSSYLASAEEREEARAAVFALKVRYGFDSNFKAACEIIPTIGALVASVLDSEPPCARAWTHTYPITIAMTAGLVPGVEALIKRVVEREAEQLREREASRVELQARSTKNLFALARSGTRSLAALSALDILEARANDRIAERVTQLEEGLRELRSPVPRAEEAAKLELTPQQLSAQAERLGFSLRPLTDIERSPHFRFATLSGRAEKLGYVLITRQHYDELFTKNGEPRGRDKVAAESVLANMGHDATCRACMQRAFTGEARFVNHTCGGKGPYGAPLAGGEPTQVLSVGEQCQASWVKINKWLAARPGRVVTVSGTDADYRVALHDETKWKYVGVGAPRSRPDALAHAAQWCETELSK